jgi:hypothetical protein
VPGGPRGLQNRCRFVYRTEVGSIPTLSAMRWNGVLGFVFYNDAAPAGLGNRVFGVPFSDAMRAESAGPSLTGPRAFLIIPRFAIIITIYELNL